MKWIVSILALSLSSLALAQDVLVVQIYAIWITANMFLGGSRTNHTAFNLAFRHYQWSSYTGIISPSSNMSVT
jgi:hypothetical protein